MPFTCCRCGQEETGIAFIPLTHWEYTGSLCDDCYNILMTEDENEEELEENTDHPEINDKDDVPNFTKEEVLALFKSKRTFGLEFETYRGVNNNNLKQYALSLGYTYAHDGSISGYNGVEYQTSVLKGEKGAETVFQFLSKAEENKNKVNTSCGTHVHLGSHDFFDNISFKLSNLTDINDKDTIVVERVLLNNMLESFGSQEAVIDSLTDLYTLGNGNQGYSNSFRMKDGKVSRYSVVKIYLPLEERNYTFSYVVRNSTLDKFDVTIEEVNNGNKMIKLETCKINSTGIISVKATDIVIYTRERSSKSRHLKTLLLFYTKFEKLLFAMLPENRANNTYCSPLSQSYSQNDIERCRTQEDIEKLWYKKVDMRDVKRAKTQHYDDSRYQSVNLHAMFYKYGTTEIRSHHGTLNAKSILCWVALHQTILDGIITGKANVIFDLNRQSLRDVKSQLDMFIRIFKLKGTTLEKFINHRINKFNPKSLK